FDTGDFRAAEAAAASDLDALGAQAHGRCHGFLHRTAERHALLKLAGDVLADELGIDFRAFDFPDVDVDLLSGEMLHLAAQALDFLALLTDHDTRTGGEQ